MLSSGIGRPAEKCVIRARFPDISHGDYRESTMPSKEYMRKWYLANREKVIARARQWAIDNPEKTKDRISAWHASNPDRVAIAKSKYREKNKDALNKKHSDRKKANPEVGRIDRHNRRAKIAGEKLTIGLSGKLLVLQKNKCPVCFSDLRKTEMHMDHIMPIALGGRNVDSNIQLLCKSCNLKKSAKHPIDFMQERGLLL